MSEVSCQDQPISHPIPSGYSSTLKPSEQMLIGAVATKTPREIGDKAANILKNGVDGYIQKRFNDGGLNHTLCRIPITLTLKESMIANELASHLNQRKHGVRNQYIKELEDQKQRAKSGRERRSFDQRINKAKERTEQEAWRDKCVREKKTLAEEKEDTLEDLLAWEVHAKTAQEAQKAHAKYCQAQQQYENTDALFSVRSLYNTLDHANALQEHLGETTRTAKLMIKKGMEHADGDTITADLIDVRDALQRKRPDHKKIRVCLNEIDSKIEKKRTTMGLPPERVHAYEELRKSVKEASDVLSDEA